MNGIHDLGGAHGYGPVYREPNEPVFRHDWEKRVMALFPALFANGHFNVDEFRHSIERMGAIHYLQGTYYEHWLHVFENLMVEKGVLTATEVASGKAASGKTATPVLTTAIVDGLLSTGASAAREAEGVQARFAVGDKVRVINKNPVGHTRMPRYTRGKVGTIAIDHGAFVTPDTVAHGKGEHPQHVYTVQFTAVELWGQDSSSTDTVCVDLWDDYLEVA